jgi:hypothetical protein
MPTSDKVTSALFSSWIYTHTQTHTYNRIQYMTVLCMTKFSRMILQNPTQQGTYHNLCHHSSEKCHNAEQPSHAGRWVPYYVEPGVFLWWNAPQRHSITSSQKDASWNGVPEPFFYWHWSN